MEFLVNLFFKFFLKSLVLSFIFLLISKYINLKDESKIMIFVGVFVRILDVVFFIINTPKKIIIQYFHSIFFRFAPLELGFWGIWRQD